MILSSKWLLLRRVSGRCRVVDAQAHDIVAKHGYDVDAAVDSAQRRYAKAVDTDQPGWWRVTLKMRLEALWDLRDAAVAAGLEALDPSVR